MGFRRRKTIGKLAVLWIDFVPSVNTCTKGKGQRHKCDVTPFFTYNYILYSDDERRLEQTRAHSILILLDLYFFFINTDRNYRQFTSINHSLNIWRCASFHECNNIINIKNINGQVMYIEFILRSLGIFILLDFYDYHSQTRKLYQL